jgi:hypothetical protein
MFGVAGLIAGVYGLARQSRVRGLISCTPQAGQTTNTRLENYGCTLSLDGQRKISETVSYQSSKYGLLRGNCDVRVFLDWSLKSGYINVKWDRIQGKGETEYRFSGSEIEGKVKTRMSTSE